ncbi:MAG: hypothetical protein VKL39_14640 [Leptolyngbyaceae bacterium]|nr:hypothetical protein [Leptolyngbyaceae bacterium]
MTAMDGLSLDERGGRSPNIRHNVRHNQKERNGWRESAWSPPKD